MPVRSAGRVLDTIDKPTSEPQAPAALGQGFVVGDVGGGITEGAGDGTETSFVESGRGQIRPASNASTTRPSRANAPIRSQRGIRGRPNSTTSSSSSTRP